MRDYRTHVIVFLSLTTAATGYLAWQNARELSLLRNAPPTQPNIAEARRAAWASHKNPTLPESDAYNTESSEAPSPAAESPTTGRVRPTGFGEGAMLKLLEKPKYVRLLSMQQKARLDPRFAALFKQLGLPPERLDSFKNLLVEKQSVLIDTYAAARSQGLDPRQDRELFRELATNAQNEIDESIREMLGDAAFANYENYVQTLPYRNLTDQLQARLSYSPSPLTDSQTEQLVQIIANTATSGGSNPQGSPTRTIRGSNRNNREIAITDDTILQAAGILTPDQQVVLQQLQAEQTAAKQLREMTRSSFNPSNLGAPVKQSDSAK